MSSPQSMTPLAAEPVESILESLDSIRNGGEASFDALRAHFRALEEQEARARAMGAPAPPVAEPAPEVVQGPSIPLMSPEALARAAAQGPGPAPRSPAPTVAPTPAPGIPVGVARVPAAQAVRPAPAPAPAPAARRVEPTREVAKPTLEDLAEALDRAGYLFAQYWAQAGLLELDVRLGIALTPEGWEIGSAAVITNADGSARQRTITGHRVQHDALGTASVRIMENTIQRLGGD